MAGPLDARVLPDALPVSGGSLIEFITIWNQGQNQSTPSLHCKIARWLHDCWAGDERELLLMAFRNAGKSTLVGLFAAWLLHRDPDCRIIVLSADHQLARRMVRNVKRIIERHPLTDGLKPPGADEWAADRFTLIRGKELRDPSMLARGIGANITGSRADVVICDDVEVPRTCNTPGKREDLRERLDEIEYVLVPGGLKLFVGTPHTRNSIYAIRSTDLENPSPYLYDYKRLELTLVDEHGNSRWPERFSAEHIEAIKRRSGPAKFASQMMLRPMSIMDGRLDPDRLVVYDAELDYREAGGEAELRLGARRLVSASCWWDPSYGAPGRGDASVIAVVFTDEDGNYRLHEVAYLSHDPTRLDEADEATQQCRAVIEFVARLHLSGVTVESNGIGRFLPGLLRSEVIAAGLPIAVDAVHSTQSKDLRIVDAFDAPMAASRLYVQASVMRTPLIDEMREWRPGTNTRDDGLDAVAGCLLSEPIRLPRRVGSEPPKRAPEWRRGVRPFTAKTDFNL